MEPISLALAVARLVGPHLVRWVAGDGSGKVAEEVLDTALDVSGADSAKEAIEILQSSAERRAELVQQLAEREERLEGLYLADRASARSRDVDLVRAGLPNRRANLLVLGTFALLLGIGLVLVVYGAELPEVALAFLTTMGGMLTQKIGTVFDFEFGSSRGSALKTLMQQQEGP